MSGESLAGLLSRCLRAAGVTRAFRAPGHELPSPAGIEIIDVPDAALAGLLADADGRLTRSPSARPGLALLDGRRIRLSSEPGEEVLAHPVLDPDQLPGAIAGWTVGQVHAALELEIDLELADLAPEGLEPLTLAPADDRLVTLSPSLASMDTVIVVGSGVVRDAQVAGVAEAARRTGARLVATPGALGVVPLDDPAWHGVVGLQVADASMSGLEGAELVIVAGLDPAEALGVVPDGVQVLEVEPWHLGLMAHHWPDREPGAPDDDRGRALVDGLAALAAAGRSSSALPLHPVRAAADLAAVLDPEELLLADPGPAGLWLQRGVVARPAGSVVVPSFPVHGFAAAAALVAGLDRRPAVAVVTSPTDPATDAVLDLAASLGVTLICEVWGAESSWASASEHRERLVGARHEGGVQRLGVPVDLAATRELIELAGPVQAWTGGPVDEPGSFT
jgi:hypothetical protein